MSTRAIPQGFHALTPYLVSPGLDRLIEFLKAAFGAVEIERHCEPDGRVMHAEVKIGDSIVMMGEPREPWKPMPCMLYHYVPDTDAVYERALRAGGESMQEPADMFYGDRNAGVKDPSGNLWWIATRLEDLSPQEIERRAAQQRGGR